MRTRKSFPAASFFVLIDYFYARMMKGKLLIEILFLALVSGLSMVTYAGPGNQATGPNIILIMCDDMGYECLSSNGSLSYSTPSLDKLARKGLRFTQCYSQPLCTPSRVKIMTGRYNSNNYIDFGYLDVREKTFGNVLKDAGYKTMIAGKWQLNGINTNEEGCMDPERPYQFGFEEYCLWWLTEKGSRYADPLIVQNGTRLETTIDDYGPDLVLDYILNFIERNKNEPFFVYYPMMLVHSPFQPTPDSPEWADPDKRNSTDNKFFKDMVEYTDKIVGKIFASLEEQDLLENTILIFTGDNGTNTDIITETKDGPYKGGKGRLFDNGTHVPLVISYPGGGKKAEVGSELIEFSDFLPTFADAAKTSLPPGIDGRSFYRLLANQRYKPRKYVFVHYYPNTTNVSNRSGCFVRTKDYKLYTDGRFFDMQSDKWEKTPLNAEALSKEEKKVYKQLNKELKNKIVWDFSIPHRNKTN